MTITDRPTIESAPEDDGPSGPRRGTKGRRSLLHKIPIALFVVAALLAAPTAVRLISGASDDSAPLLTPGRSSDRADARQQVSFWRGRVGGELDYLNRNQLAVALLEQARQTGDLGAYAEAETVIGESLQANPTGTEGRTIAAAVQYGIHEFPGALERAEDVLADDPTAVQALSVAGDAALEVGEYERADDYYTQLYGSQPGPAATVRLARLRWQQGDADEAVLRAREALGSANASRLPPPDVAFYALQLATFLFDTGDIDEAETLATASVEIAPALPAGHAIRGRALAAQGDVAEAIASYEQAVAIIPRPEYLAALGDLYALSGDVDRSEQQYLAVDLIAEIADIEQVVYNRELARFFADHDRQTERAAAMARAELEVRRDVLGYDTLAWALYSNGDIDEAADVVDTLRGFGSVDPEVRYHIGMILGAVGDRDGAIAELQAALDANPDFDPIHGPRAERRLAELRDDS